ncbi:hypothetical protein CDL12_14071 [Handroanthus impetiginosus]|uniref:Uncharacterized protein n=1 Tax=Handroanthus impetiginosus TaxID=429701 RepID=A0A2G9H7L9_9LAMI|nr:hypothetical protein CDL12_14071 [Handroanthus impetiginosus]
MTSISLSTFNRERTLELRDYTYQDLYDKIDLTFLSISSRTTHNLLNCILVGLIWKTDWYIQEQTTFDRKHSSNEFPRYWYSKRSILNCRPQSNFDLYPHHTIIFYLDIPH